MKWALCSVAATAALLTAGGAGAEENTVKIGVMRR